MKVYEIIEGCDCWFHCECGLIFHGKFRKKKNAKEKLQNLQKEHFKQYGKYYENIYIDVERTKD